MQDARLLELNDLYRRMQDDPGYRNQAMGNVFVPGAGSPGGGTVFIGEAPGREEEREGAPFVGPAGRNLNSLLESIGLKRETVFITNLVKYRPHNPKGENRPPTTGESRKALPYLLEELRILSPEVVVCLGLSVAKSLFQNPRLKMGDANGAIMEQHGFRTLTTYHPSPLNYNVPAKRDATQSAFALLGRLLREGKAAGDRGV
ncbi:MAG: uracil-DNA glycosylase [Syntrophobacteraceae bacterium]